MLGLSNRSTLTLLATAATTLAAAGLTPALADASSGWDRVTLASGQRGVHGVFG